IRADLCGECCRLGCAESKRAGDRKRQREPFHTASVPFLALGLPMPDGQAYCGCPCCGCACCGCACGGWGCCGCGGSCFHTWSDTGTLIIELSRWFINHRPASAITPASSTRGKVCTNTTSKPANARSTRSAPIQSSQNTWKSAQTMATTTTISRITLRTGHSVHGTAASLVTWSTD